MHFHGKPPSDRDKSLLEYRKLAPLDAIKNRRFDQAQYAMPDWLVSLAPKIDIRAAVFLH
jgi:hypothetical protein